MACSVLPLSLYLLLLVCVDFIHLGTRWWLGLASRSYFHSSRYVERGIVFGASRAGNQYRFAFAFKLGDSQVHEYSLAVLFVF